MQENPGEKFPRYWHPVTQHTYPPFLRPGKRALRIVKFGERDVGRLNFDGNQGGKRIKVYRARKRRDVRGTDLGWGNHRKKRKGGTIDMSMHLLT